MKTKKPGMYAKGPLSNQDKLNIEEWVATMDVIDIAQRLNRSPKQIERYKNEFLAKAPRIIAKRSETEEFRRELHASANWNTIRQQFTHLELVFYENQYIEYRRQFKEMTSTEKTQLNHLITLDILMNRHQIERKKNQEAIDRIEKFLDKEYKKDLSLLTLDEKNIITNHETQLAAHKASSSSRTKEYNDLLAKHTDILKSLKSTRDQRIKNLEDRGKFIGLLHELEIQSRRMTIGQETALAEMAKQKELERLSQPFKYNDNVIDQPILSYETNNTDYD